MIEVIEYESQTYAARHKIQFAVKHFKTKPEGKIPKDRRTFAVNF